MQTLRKIDFGLFLHAVLLLGLCLTSGCEKFSGSNHVDDRATDSEQNEETESASDSGGDVSTDSNGDSEFGSDTGDTDSDLGTDTPDMETDTSPPVDTDTNIDSGTETGAQDSSGLCRDEDGDDWCVPFDCDDENPEINLDVEETLGDNVDNDCDGQTDELSQKDLDMDGDGFSPNEGDCADIGEGAEFVNPDAIEDLGDDGKGDAVDNDCDGQTDEDEQCDCPEVGTGPWDFVDAVDLCNRRFVEGPILVYSATDGDKGYQTLPSMGSNDCLLSQRFCEMAAISTGPVGQADPNNAQFMSQPPWTSYSLDPLPAFTGSTPTNGKASPTCDLTQIRLQLRAPSNAQGFSFDFLFASAEYPEWVQRGYNDTFYAIIEHPDINGGAPTNISFDADNNEIEVDVNFFENALFPCDESGSGWAPADSGSTGWLKTSWNINPGDRFSLTFSIHDEGDCKYDSIVFIDNFQWKTSPVEPGTQPI